MAYEHQGKPDDGSSGGDGGGRVRRSPAERREFANVTLHWAASVNAMQAVVDRYGLSVESLRETGGALDTLARDRKVAAILKTIEMYAETERRSVETRAYLQALAEAIMSMPEEPIP